MAGLALAACGEDGQEGAGNGGKDASGGSGTTSVGGAGETAAGGATGGEAGAGAAAGGAGGGAPAQCSQLAAGPLDTERAVPSWNDRAYDLHVPPGYDCTQPAAVVLAIHGGGGTKELAAQYTCPGDDPSNPPQDVFAEGCMNHLADQRNVVVEWPNGNRNPALGEERRTFDAGGGSDGYCCVSGYACTQGFDEIDYFTKLLDDLESVINVDTKRVYATGMSNGAAMAHVLACEMADRIAAIAPVAVGNQHASLESCNPQRPVPVLQIHGDADPYWPYLGGDVLCILTMQAMVGIPASAAVVTQPSTVGGWLTRNGCGSTSTTQYLPDLVAGDGVVRTDSYPSCNAGADVVLYTIEGGGHTWPGGFSPSAAAGTVNRDINASEVILDFFAAHPMP